MPPTSAARASDERLPVVRSRRKCARFGMIAGFSPAGTERTPAVHAPTATKLMCPNESTPRVADEDVERGDDRHLHEGVGDVRLRRERDDGSE